MPEDWGAEALVADTALPAEITPSPNIGDRAVGKTLDMIILHYTGMVSGAAALDWLCREEAQVSCHYLVFEDGTLHQMVAENKRAWHAGKSYWRGETDINSRSIGIEIVNPGHQYGYVDFPDAQMECVVALVADICGRHAIPAANILAHSDIAPMRKEDPGERFDWQRLHNAGLGVWIEPSPVKAGDCLQLGDKNARVLAFQEMLHTWGYGVECNGKFDALTHACTVAFQRHFRQQNIDGIADFSTVETLKRLLKLEI